MKAMTKRLTAVLTALALLLMLAACAQTGGAETLASSTGGGNTEPVATDPPEDPQGDDSDGIWLNPYTSETISVEGVEGLSQDFMMGVDISSIVSELESGVTFQDFSGNTLDDVGDFCRFLREDCGITDVRVRIWNDPYDADGNGYGGGNCDLAHAAVIAEACAQAGLRLYVDFHYSDFWADPSRQLVPKAWEGFSLAQKAEALAQFTTEALSVLAQTGVTIAMVQVGNETTTGLAGEDSVENICALLNAGAGAVRAFDPEISVVVHVTNPEESNMTIWAGYLAQYGVDYDILATSYYPFWHGDMDNLADQLEQVHAQYGKAVFVAETYYAYTVEDFDGQANVIRDGQNDDTASYGYEYTVSGQAQYLRDLIAVISQAGGIGLFYWEPAWITVGNTVGLSGAAYASQVAENETLWNAYGSGWATEAAGIYDPEFVGDGYGGTETDNIALFAPDGSPLASLHVFRDVRENAAGPSTPGEEDPGVEETEAPTQNQDDSGGDWIPYEAQGFESDGPYTVEGNGITIPSQEDVLDGNFSMHWFDTVASTSTVTLNSGITLPAGSYAFSALAMGAEGDGVTLVVCGEDGAVIASSEQTVLTGWSEWESDWSVPYVEFSLSEETTVYLQIRIDFASGGWGSVDRLCLTTVQ